MAGSLGSTAARGAFATLSGQGMRIVLQFAGVVVLARLLTPHDYGLIAIVVVIIGIGEIFRDFGLSHAVVRAHELTEDQSTNLFWVNTGIGAVLGVILFSLAGPLASAAGQPEVLGIARAMAAVFLLNGLATQFRAHLLRALRFRRLAVIEVLAPAAALAVAIMAALAGWGYWSLVVQQITNALVILTGTATSERWRPGLPRRDTSIRSFLRFGGNLVLSQLVNYGTNNLDTAVIGFVYGATPLGLYNRAYQLVVRPLSQIQSPVTSVAIPILSKIQEDKARFGAYLVRGQKALGYPISLGLGAVIVAAHPIVELMLGSTWIAAVPLLQLFAAGGIARNLAFVGYWVYVVRGLSGELFRYSLATAIIPILGVIVGSHWGVIGVATGFAIAPWLEWGISLIWLSRVTVIPVRSLFTTALRIILVTAATAAIAEGATILLPPLPVLLAIAVPIAIMAAVFGLLVVLIPTLRRDAHDLFHIVTLLRDRRRA